ncbi:MAG: vitamin K epoxide reductase [Anaerolineaceae bacterium]|nr:vitamin K epoxide reductase [Anaerolineaceae bacterium]
MIKKCVLLLLMLLLSGTALAAQAQPVAYAVFFYSPTCPHCHEVMNNYLPVVQDQFGDQLQVLYVDVTTEGGQSLAQSAYQYYQIPRSNWVVPMLVIDEQILTGSGEIPAYMGGIVENGLARGGIDLPAFPGLREAYMLYLSQSGSGEAQPAAPAGAITPASTTDSLANGLALVVLAGLIVSLIAVLARRPSTRLVRLAGLIAVGAGGLLALSLAVQTEAVAGWLAWGMLIGLVVAGYLLMRQGPRGIVLPLAIVGLIDAGYLAYVELTQTEATCGAVGNCNAVQQSAYAQIFGVPIGVIGLVGYVLILGVWLLGDRLDSPLPRLALFGMALAGTVFSIYLTFLEPFVIGAVCTWCLISAVVMLAVLWMVAPAGWQAWQQTRQMRISTT